MVILNESVIIILVITVAVVMISLCIWATVSAEKKKVKEKTSDNVEFSPALKGDEKQASGIDDNGHDLQIIDTPELPKKEITQAKPIHRLRNIPLIVTSIAVFLVLSGLVVTILKSHLADVVPAVAPVDLIESSEDFIESNIESEAESEVESDIESKPMTRDNSTAKMTTLYAGTFYVGDDIPAGRYVFSSKGRGNFVIYSGGENLLVNEILTDEKDGFGVPTVTVNIIEGDTIEISGIESVTCKPAQTKVSTVLSAGYWQVGLDAPSGTYDVFCREGESGNFIVYSGGEVKCNEILDNKNDNFGVEKIRVDFEDGDIVNISGISKVYFTIVN